MMLRRRSAHRMRGFSFVELLVSLAIMATLAMVAMPLAEATTKRQKEHELRLALQNIRQAIDAYKHAVLNGTIKVQAGHSGYPTTLLDLTGGVPNEKDPKAPPQYFLRRIPRDPFYPNQNGAAIDTWGKRSFASSAEHPQEGDDVFDVYSKSSLTGLDGLPYSEW